MHKYIYSYNSQIYIDRDEYKTCMSLLWINLKYHPIIIYNKKHTLMNKV